MIPNGRAGQHDLKETIVRALPKLRRSLFLVHRHQQYVVFIDTMASYVSCALLLLVLLHCGAINIDQHHIATSVGVSTLILADVIDWMIVGSEVDGSEVVVDLEVAGSEVVDTRATAWRWQLSDGRRLV